MAVLGGEEAASVCGRWAATRRVLSSNTWMVPAGYRVQASPGVDDLTPVAMLSDGSDKSSHQPVGVAVRL